MTSSDKLIKILDAQRSPLIKTGIGYEGETSKVKEKENRNIIFVKVVKDNEAAQKVPTEVETCNEVNRNKKEPQMTKNETNKQSTEKGSCTPKYIKFGSYQKRSFPPMKNVSCYAYHKPGHIVAYCHKRRIDSNQ